MMGGGRRVWTDAAGFSWHDSSCFFHYSLLYRVPSHTIDLKNNQLTAEASGYVFAVVLTMLRNG